MEPQSHHAVEREDAFTTKVREVMAKVSAEAASLNEDFYTCPILASNILDIFSRFRWFKVPLVSDIEKAFHMIRVDERDRGSLWFLCLSGLMISVPLIQSLFCCDSAE